VAFGIGANVLQSLEELLQRLQIMKPLKIFLLNLRRFLPGNERNPPQLIELNGRIPLSKFKSYMEKVINR